MHGGSSGNAYPFALSKSAIHAQKLDKNDAHMAP
jgi:hypothetical protein